MRWLAPDAGKSTPPAAANADAKAILKELGSEGADDALANLEKGGDSDLKLPDAGTASRELTGDALKKRLALIDRALSAGSPEIAAALAEQLATVAGIPTDVRLRIFALLKRDHPASAAAQGRTALRAKESVIQGNGYVLLASAGDPEFVKQLAKPQEIAGEPGDAKQERLRDLALAVALYPKADLVEQGRRQIDAWNKQEAATRADFAKVCGPDIALVETFPCLDAEALYGRLAWLAYMYRNDPKAFAEPFLHEWLMASQYMDYCGRAIDNVYNQQKYTGARAEAACKGWSNLSERFRALQNMTRPEVEAMLTSSPAESGAVLAKIRFTAEAQTAISLLGNIDRKAAAPVLTPMASAKDPDLSAFAKTRAGKSE
jgi:hypothetical protein